ncbi:MAG: hypothetical protein J7513_07200 [Solirubrobacteraceae bacterium]|nr:hypothetical protein [Solirubrobacteraceae bacterium]
MDASRGSITVTALMGTGAVTLGVALFGLAGVGSDLRAADAANRSTPAITTQDLSDSLREERRSPKWDGHSDCPPASGDDAATGTTPERSPQPVPTSGASAASKEI